MEIPHPLIATGVNRCFHLDQTLSRVEDTGYQVQMCVVPPKGLKIRDPHFGSITSHSPYLEVFLTIKHVRTYNSRIGRQHSSIANRKHRP